MTFDAIGIAGTALNTHRRWLDAISDNMANINTATRTDGAAFQARYIAVADGEGQTGVRVTGGAFGDAEGRLVHEPTHPLADEDGYVRYPEIDLASQMGQLILAQRGYQANAAVVDRAKVTYEAALQIGEVLMPIDALSGVGAVAASGYRQQVGAGSADGSSFAATLAGAIDGLRAQQSVSNELAIKAVTGDLTDIHQATLASTRAQVTLELVAGVRNKGVDAFNEIMRMQA